MKTHRLKLLNVQFAQIIHAIGYWIIAISLMSFAAIYVITAILLWADSMTMSEF